MSKDLFIRRLYTYRGVHVVVDIDLVKKQLTLMEHRPDNQFKPKEFKFQNRELEYMGGWILILDAMKHAIKEASKELEAAKDRDEKEFMNLLYQVGKSLDEKEKDNE